MLTLDRKITFGHVLTRYAGRVEKCCLVFLPGEDGAEVSLGDTMRCAQDVDACKRTLHNLAGQVGSDPDHAIEFANLMHVHCKALTKWVEKPKRDVQRASANRRQYR